MNAALFRSGLKSLFFVALSTIACRGQRTPADSSLTKDYVIEVAGLRVGKMTATRQPRDKQTVVYTLVSDVQVNFLVYKLIIYYKVINLVRQGRLIRSTVDAHTNRGTFASRTEWKGDHYEISADQYKYTRKSTETRPIDYTVTDMFFTEPTNQNRAYSEYFGDYFALTSPAKGQYRARLTDREDEYRYENGQLVKIIKKNPLKNFIIRPVVK